MLHSITRHPFTAQYRKASYIRLPAAARRRELHALTAATSHVLHLPLGTGEGSATAQQQTEGEEPHPLRPPFDLCRAHRGIQYAGTAVQELRNTVRIQ